MENVARSSSTVYAQPRVVDDLNDCFFYHTIDIPGHGTAFCPWGWDLRGREREYTGGIDFQGKRVLEFGTASGFLCFYMEKQGAEVVACDVCEHDSVDIVPSARCNYRTVEVTIKDMVRQLNNSFWFTHRAFQSKAKVVYSSAYFLPDEVGQFDICTFGAILLHLRDPFRALQKGLERTRETVIIADMLPKIDGPYMEFLPEAGNLGGWWAISPGILVKMIAELGFEDSKVTYHKQKRMAGDVSPFFTIVGKRTRPLLPAQPAATKADNRKFVSEVYHELLEREPERIALDSWSGFLDQGGNRDEMKRTIKDSSEYRRVDSRRYLRGMYREMLDREPELAEIDSWMGFLSSGGTCEKMKQSIESSPEYRQVQDRRCVSHV
jgi:hypothetical protein